MPRYYDTLDKHMDSVEIDPCMAAQIRLKKRKKIGPKMIAFGAILLILLVVGILVACAIFLLPSLLSQTHQSPDKSSTENQTLNEGSDHSSDLFSQPVPSPTSLPDVPKIRPFVDYDTSISAKAATEINTYGTYFETCDDYFRNGFTQSGIYRLQRPSHYDFKTQCEMNVDGDNQAWMVMQKRTGNTVMFWNRTMEEYAQGFGDIFTNYWLGLRNVRHLIEAGHRLQLKMQVEGERCVGRSAYYVGIWRFEIGSELEGFRLGVSRILQGNFTDSLANIESNHGKQFSAMDPKSNSEITCQERMRTGGWWVGFNQCPFFSLNGEYSCNRPRSVYGLFVYQRQRSASGILSTGYLHPQATQMSLRICREDTCM